MANLNSCFLEQVLCLESICHFHDKCGLQANYHRDHFTPEQTQQWDASWNYKQRSIQRSSPATSSCCLQSFNTILNLHFCTSIKPMLPNIPFHREKPILIFSTWYECVCRIILGNFSPHFLHMLMVVWPAMSSPWVLTSFLGTTG